MGRGARLIGVLVVVAVLAASAFAGAFPDGPRGPRIAIVNESTVVGDEEINAALPMLQLYLDQVCEAWHCDGSLYLASTAPAERDWRLVINDVSDEPLAIGYHLTEGSRPIGYVSAATAQDAGVAWSVVLTHELAEMLVDPAASVAAQTKGDPSPAFTALEVCDPVQGRSYRLGKVVVADYVYRSWFTPGARGPYDSMRVLSAPLQLARESWVAEFRDGYWSARSTFTRAAAGWDSFGRRRAHGPTLDQSLPR